MANEAMASGPNKVEGLEVNMVVLLPPTIRENYHHRTVSGPREEAKVGRWDLSFLAEMNLEKLVQVLKILNFPVSGVKKIISPAINSQKYLLTK